MKVSPLDLADPMLADFLIMRSKPKRQQIAASALRHAAWKNWQTLSPGPCKCFDLK
jgi:hypothetical protein